jgi:cytochrome c-type biogenesis protein CcmH/NrfG
MKKLSDNNLSDHDEMFLVQHSQTVPALPAVLAGETSNLLMKMFRDPRLLETEERTDLIAQLRSALELTPQVVEIRVMLGMALCVNLEAQEAMEEMRRAVRTEPDCFIARLKFGELLMRLRVCDQAAEHTQEAARLASNLAQSEMARRQAATIRTMMREGIERGGYKALLPKVLRFRRKSNTASTAPALAGSK